MAENLSPSAFERRVASRLLELRRTDFSLSSVFLLQLRSYAVLFIAVGLAIAYFHWLNIRPVVFAMVGTLIGALLRDFGIARAQKRMWPIQKRLFDWDKVERLAGGELIEPR